MFAFSPMSLDVIRTRLDPSSPNHYKDISSFIADVRLIFKNTYLFYQVSNMVWFFCLFFLISFIQIYLFLKFSAIVCLFVLENT